MEQKIALRSAETFFPWRKWKLRFKEDEQRTVHTTKITRLSDLTYCPVIFKHWSSKFLRLQNVKIRVTMQAKRSRSMRARFIVSDCWQYLSFYLFNDIGLSGFRHQVIQQKVFWNLSWTFFFVHITTSFDITLKRQKSKTHIDMRMYKKNYKTEDMMFNCSIKYSYK